MNAIAWICLMLLVGLGVMVLEVLLPSGGVLGFVSALALVAAVATAFLERGAAAGMAVLAVVVLAVPAVLAMALRWFPHTRLGRQVLPPPPEPADVLPAADRRRHVRGLVGRAGRTTSELLPWGGVEIDGEMLTAVSESGPLAAGIAVEVVAAQGTSVVVRRSEPREPPGPPRGEPAPAGLPEAAEAVGGLSPTLEIFDFEGFDRPVA